MARITKAEKEKLKWYQERIHTLAKFLGPNVDPHGFDPGFLFHIVSPNYGTIDLDKNLGDDLYKLLINLSEFFQQFGLFKKDIDSRLTCPVCYQYRKPNFLAPEDEGCSSDCLWGKMSKTFDELNIEERLNIK